MAHRTQPGKSDAGTKVNKVNAAGFVKVIKGSVADGIVFAKSSDASIVIVTEGRGADDSEVAFAHPITKGPANIRVETISEVNKRLADVAADGAFVRVVKESSPVVSVTTEGYVDALVSTLREKLIGALGRFADTSIEVLPPDELADLIAAAVPDSGPEEIDPHFADVGPFYDSRGAMRQLGNITKQALNSRRSHHSVLAMQTGDGQWLYPAWQFDGNGHVHSVLTPVLRALKGMDRWAAGVWITNEHPDLNHRSPRHALREGVDPEVVASLAAHDAALLNA